MALHRDNAGIYPCFILLDGQEEGREMSGRHPDYWEMMALLALEYKVEEAMERLSLLEDLIGAHKDLLSSRKECEEEVRI